jgi:hypothetical protein
MPKYLRVRLTVIKLNIPKCKINKMLMVTGALPSKDLVKNTQFLARIEAAEQRIAYIKSIAEKLQRKSY